MDPSYDICDRRSSQAIVGPAVYRCFSQSGNLTGTYQFASANCVTFFKAYGRLRAILIDSFGTAVAGWFGLHAVDSLYGASIQIEHTDIHQPTKKFIVFRVLQRFRV